MRLRCWTCDRWCDFPLANLKALSWVCKPCLERYYSLKPEAICLCGGEDKTRNMLCRLDVYCPKCDGEGK